MSHTKLFLLAIFTVLLITACGGRDTHYYTDNKDVLIENVKEYKDGKFMVVTAGLRNNSKSAVNNSVYKVQWFDKHGMFLYETSWNPIIMKGGDIKYIKVRSTNPKAEEFTIVISNDAS